MPIPVKYPGVYIQELNSGSHVITGVATSITAFVGRTASGPTVPTAISSFAQFQSLYGGLSAGLPLTYAIRDFFQNGGSQAIIVQLTASAATQPANSASQPLAATDFIGDQASRTGIYQLEAVPQFNILCIPPDTFTTDIDPTVWAAAATYCSQRHAMLIIDPPMAWSAALKSGHITTLTPAVFGITSAAAGSVAVYAPRIIEPDPLNSNQLTAYAPSGAIAGIWAAADTKTGVWKAPSGAGATLTGITSLEINLTDAQNGVLNPLGINCLRHFPAQGNVVWGARTLATPSTGDATYQYISTRRLSNYIEASISTSIQWAIFEPNAEPLWAQLRLSIGSFMQTLFRQGAFPGTTPNQAYFVKCDSETTTQADIANGIVNIVIGFAPLKPAEFVVIQIQQLLASSPS